MRTRDVLAANLKNLLAQSGTNTLPKITMKSSGKLSNGKLDRMRRAVAATDVDALDDLAEVFGLQPWQLLVPGLDLQKLPVIAGEQLLEQIRALVASERETPVADHSAQPQTDKPDAVTVNVRSRKFKSEMDITGSGSGSSKAGKAGRVPKQGRRGRS